MICWISANLESVSLVNAESKSVDAAVDQIPDAVRMVMSHRLRPSPQPVAKSLHRQLLQQAGLPVKHQLHLAAFQDFEW